MLTQYHTQKYIHCIEQEHYFEAHEVLEELWFPSRFHTQRAEVMLLKGFINAAVSFELVKRGRKESALKVWQNYKKYIPLLSQIDTNIVTRYQYLQSCVEKKHLSLHQKKFVF